MELSASGKKKDMADVSFWDFIMEMSGFTKDGTTINPLILLILLIIEGRYFESEVQFMFLHLFLQNFKNLHFVLHTYMTMFRKQ